MSVPQAPQGPVPAIGIPDSQDYPRLVFSAPYFNQVPLAELIAPTVTEAVEAALPGLVPPYVNDAANAAVMQLAVLLAGSTMQGPLYLNPVMPTQPAQAASMAYVDSMIATAGIPEVPPTPVGQVWARETGQWVPISQSGGTYLPLGGGTMQGQINMSGNAITNLPALPVMPNGAAPAQWVLNQIASVSLYQGTWDIDTYVPDLTQLSTHVNGYTWIAITTSPSGVVIGPPIPGLQGQTVFNGDTVIYSATAGAFQAIHSGGLTLPEAQALFLPLAGGQMSGALLLNANATQPTQAVTLQQLQGITAGFISPEAPTDGQGYLRVGLTQGWVAGLPLGGGSMLGQLLLNGNASNALQAVPYQQLVSYTAGNFLPLSGGAMTGLIQLSGNASANNNPVTLGQLNSMLGSYLPLSGGTLTGNLSTGTSNLTVGGTTALQGNLGVSGTTTHTNNTLMNVTGGPLTYPPSPVPPLWLASPNNPVLVIDNYNGGETMLFRMAAGTPGASTVPVPGQSLGDITWEGWIGGGYQAYPSTTIRPSPAETWTGTAQGSQLAFGVTQNGTVPIAGWGNTAWPLTLVWNAVEVGTQLITPTMVLTGTNFYINSSGGVPYINWAGNVYENYQNGSWTLINGPDAYSFSNSGRFTQQGDATNGCWIVQTVYGGRTWSLKVSPTDGHWAVGDESAGAERLQIDTSGNIRVFNLFPFGDDQGSVGYQGNSWYQMGSYYYYQASDPRGKVEMVPAPYGALDKVNQVPVINYRHENHPENRIGFNAADLHRVHPDLTKVDADGNATGYSLSDVAGLLWQAVQELAAKVATLEAAAKTA